jgi:hypothetical protein
MNKWTACRFTIIAGPGNAARMQQYSKKTIGLYNVMFE